MDLMNDMVAMILLLWYHFIHCITLWYCAMTSNYDTDAMTSYYDTVAMTSNYDTVAMTSNYDTVAMTSYYDTIAMTSNYDTVAMVKWGDLNPGMQVRMK